MQDRDHGGSLIMGWHASGTMFPTRQCSMTNVEVSEKPEARWRSKASDTVWAIDCCSSHQEANRYARYGRLLLLLTTISSLSRRCVRIRFWAICNQKMTFAAEYQTAATTTITFRARLGCEGENKTCLHSRAQFQTPSTCQHQLCTTRTILTQKSLMHHGTSHSVYVEYVRLGCQESRLEKVLVLSLHDHPR